MSKESCEKKHNENQTSGYHDIQKKPHFHVLSFEKLRFWCLGGQNANRRSDSHEPLLTPLKRLNKVVERNGMGIGLPVIKIRKETSFSTRRL